MRSECLKKGCKRLLEVLRAARRGYFRRYVARLVCFDVSAQEDKTSVTLTLMKASRLGQEVELSQQLWQDNIDSACA